MTAAAAAGERRGGEARALVGWAALLSVGTRARGAGLTIR